MSLKKFFFPFISVVVLLCGSSLWAEELNVYFKTTPRQELLRPFADPIDLSLLVTGADGQPVKEGTVAIRLHAPRPGRFFSTDIPLVEGTLLNEMQLPLRQGRASWKQLLPIRGEYRLTVDVTANEGAQLSKVFTFDVRENRIKWLVLSAFSAALLLLGFIAGRIFTVGPTGAALVLLTVAMLVGSAQSGDAQGSETDSPAVLEIEPATVGRPSVVRWKLSGAGSGGDRAALLSLSITHLEKQKIMFAVEKIAVSGEWSMNFHFPDGAEYRVAAVASVAGSAPLRNERSIAVTGVEPPASATVPVLGFFIALIAVGLGVGRWSKRRGAAYQRAIPGKNL